MYKIIKSLFKIYHYIQGGVLRIVARFCSKQLDISGYDKVLIISPHPDDEVIGCAGLIQALGERGTPPHVIIMTGVRNHCLPLA